MKLFEQLTPAVEDDAPFAADLSYRKSLSLLALGLLLVTLASIRWGAVPLSISTMRDALLHVITGQQDLSLDERIFLTIRLPRAFLTLFVGASLAVGGVLMQGLFRNPIVEPGLIGTSSGAAFGAALYFVLGASLKFSAGPWTLPIAASVGAALSTFMVYRLSGAHIVGGSSVVALLLTGIAINALFLSGVGFLSYLARDPQARSIIFWNLGTFSGTSWTSVAVVAPVTIIGIAAALREARGLNALMLGEEEAGYLGTDVRTLKTRVLIGNVVIVAVATAFVGVIAFVGLIVPHLIRLWRGGDMRFLMLGGALLGGILLGMADLTARLILSPAELPIGIVTSVVGVPVFLFLLRRQRMGI